MRERKKQGRGQGEEAPEESRVDPADGNAYTQDEFVAQYGGTAEWEQAGPAQGAAEASPAGSGGEAGDAWWYQDDNGEWQVLGWCGLLWGGERGW
jgi:hypothetical protein